MTEVLIFGWVASIVLIWVYHTIEIKKIEKQLSTSRSYSEELKKKLDANRHPILSLAELINEGVILDVSVIDRNDIFYHNGGVNR
jgi:hypothetical protein